MLECRHPRLSCCSAIFEDTLVEGVESWCTQTQWAQGERCNVPTNKDTPLLAFMKTLSRCIWRKVAWECFQLAFACITSRVQRCTFCHRWFPTCSRDCYPCRRRCCCVCCLSWYHRYCGRILLEQRVCWLCCCLDPQSSINSSSFRVGRLL